MYYEFSLIRLGDDDSMCQDRHDGWICTRVSDHEAPHAAHCEYGDVLGVGAIWWEVPVEG